MSSKRRIRRKQCEGKVRFESPGEAGRSIRSLHRKRGYRGRMNVYWCQFCGGYHFGHARRG